MYSMGAKCECLRPRVCVGGCVCPCMRVAVSTYVHVCCGMYLCGIACFTLSFGARCCDVYITFGVDSRVKIRLKQKL